MSIDAGRRPPNEPPEAVALTAEEHRRNQRAVPGPDGMPQPVDDADRVNQWWYQNHVPRDSEHAHLFQLPAPYQLTGPTPNPAHYQVDAVLGPARDAGLVPTHLPGLVLDLSGTTDRYFVTFEEVDTGQHLFAEASGGGYVFNAAVCGGSRLSALVAFRAHLRHLNTAANRAAGRVF